MNPKEYQKLTTRTECSNEVAGSRIVNPDTGELNIPVIRFNHAVLGILNEAGELAKILKGHIYHGKSLDKVHIAEEIGDLLYFAALACNAFDLDMANIMNANIAKLRARYPDKYSDERCSDRDKNKEDQALREALDKESTTGIIENSHSRDTALLCDICLGEVLSGQGQITAHSILCQKCMEKVFKRNTIEWK